MINVYDKVYAIEENKPIIKTVYSIIHVMSDDRKGLDTTYVLADIVEGENVDARNIIKKNDDEIFASREDMLRYLTDILDEGRPST